MLRPLLVAPTPLASPPCASRSRRERRFWALGAVGLAVDRRVALRCKPLEKTLREQAQQIASDKAALRLGPGGLESVVPDTERQQLAKEADTLSPFRRGVIFAAFLLLFGGLQDGLLGDAFLFGKGMRWLCGASLHVRTCT